MTEFQKKSMVFAEIFLLYIFLLISWAFSFDFFIIFLDFLFFHKGDKTFMIFPDTEPDWDYDNF